MSKGVKILLIVLAVVAVIVISMISFVVGTYNRIVSTDESVKSAWAEVNNQLQRRYDLIPNLVETVKGYASHEERVFIEVTQARAKVAGAGTIPEQIEANNQLSGALSRLLVVVEAYPELKANQNFIRLQDELAGTENRIAVARMRYNETARSFNQIIRRFPANIMAGAFGFERATFYEVPEEAKAAPKVKF